MSITVLQALLITLFCIISNLMFPLLGDIGGYFGLGRPLIAGTITGLILGDVKTGMMIGASLNAVYMSSQAVGNVMSTDVTMAGYIATALSMAGNNDPAMALALSIPIGLFGSMLFTMQNAVCVFFSHKCDEYAAKYPTIVKAIHQENGGHGEGVNQGIRNATGLYYKVVDSDDWLDTDALKKVLHRLQTLVARGTAPDLMICNYVYEHVEDNTTLTVRYTNVFPQNRLFDWVHVRHFRPDQNLLMHSVMYRTEVLRKCGMVLPKHTFYVDNIFVYQPLPYVKSMYYMDLDLYRYFIGRADQSVNESIMVKRVDQQLRVTRHMIDCQDLDALKDQKRLRAYMVHYLSVMMAVSDIFLLLDGSAEAHAKKAELWQYLKDHVTPGVYRAVRVNLGGLTDLHFPGGDKVVVATYRQLRKIFKFN